MKQFHNPQPKHFFQFFIIFLSFFSSPLIFCLYLHIILFFIFRWNFPLPRISIYLTFFILLLILHTLSPFLPPIIFFLPSSSYLSYFIFLLSSSPLQWEGVATCKGNNFHSVHRKIPSLLLVFANGSWALFSKYQAYLFNFSFLAFSFNIIYEFLLWNLGCYF